MVADIPENVEHWTAKRSDALVVSILKGVTSVAEAARKHALTWPRWKRGGTSA